MTATLGALILGVGSEYAILMMERYFEEKDKGKSPIEAIRTASSKIGSAILASGATTVFGFMALLVSPFPMISFLCITFITLSEMFAFPVMVAFWMKRSDENNRGQYAGIWTMTWAIAQSTGTFLGSSVAQHFGFTTLWWLVVILCSISIFFYAKLVKN